MTTNANDMPVRQIGRLSEISDAYDVLLCDVWGVVHDGVAAFPSASDALVDYRRRGGTVILITNAPRPAEPVRRQLLKLGASADAFDDVATSGEVTIRTIVERIDLPVLHIGPDRDLSLFDAAGKAAGRNPPRTALDEAAYALVTGLRDDVIETPEDYDDELRAMADRSLPMICANPDLVIHRGDALVYCAGALAARFETIGGSVIYAGKPHPAIYQFALELAAKARGGPINAARVLAVGDGMKTDIAGAGRMGFDSLFVTRGIHRNALHGASSDGQAEASGLQRLYADHAQWPTAAIPLLAG